MSSVRDSNLGGSARNSLSDGLKVSNSHPTVDDVISQSKAESALIDAKQPVFIDEISSNAGDSSRKDEGLLENCGILPSNCLPCLNSTVHSIEKRRSLSSSPPSTRKKAALKLSFKWREGHATGPLCKFQLSFHCVRTEGISIQELILFSTMFQFLQKCSCRDRWQVLRFRFVRSKSKCSILGQLLSQVVSGFVAKLISGKHTERACCFKYLIVCSVTNFN